MTAKYLGSPDFRIVIEAQEIINYNANLSSYTGITISVNRCDIIIPDIVYTYDNIQVLDIGNNFYIVGNNIYIKPEFFSGSLVFIDGVYKISVKFNTLTGYVLIVNCIFVDITLKCKLATLLQSLIEENKTKTKEKKTTVAYILHYALVNGSNCGCNCTEMCEVFSELKKLLLGIDPQILDDCGC